MNIDVSLMTIQQLKHELKVCKTFMEDDKTDLSTLFRCMAMHDMIEKELTKRRTSTDLTHNTIWM